MKPFPNKASRFIFEHVKPYKKHALVTFLLVLLEAGALNLSNWFFAQIIEATKNGVTEQAFHSGVIFISLMALCGVFYIFLPKMAFLYRQFHLYFPVHRNIEKSALSYIQGHSYDYITSSQTGLLLEKADQVGTVQPILSMFLVGSWSIICEIVIKTGLLMMINVSLGTLFLSCAILSYLFNTLINKKAEHISKLKNRLIALYRGRLIDIIANIRLVKQFNRLNSEQKRLETLLEQEYDLNKKSLFVNLRNYTAVGILINICSMIILTYAVYLWSKDQLGMGDIVFVLLTLTSGLNYLIEFHDIIRQLKNTLAYVNEGLIPFTVPHAIQDIPNAPNLHIKKAQIEFKQVNFSYNKKKPVLKSFNLEIKEGEKIGIVGLSGSGKTTLINLLQRAYEINEGEILIAGQNIAAITQDSLHQNIALIPQETTLFHRTIRENIAFGKPEATEAEIIEASKLAFAEDFIKDLPQGYDSLVGDRGCNLSGGERQRVAIARAILKDSPILVLDEATSSLDSESEHLVSQAISGMLKDKTVIAIAHRLSTLKEMDRIVVLEKGKIVESGSFEELYHQPGGKFAHLWKLQQIKRKKEEQ